MRLLFLALLLMGCGGKEQQEFEINGEIKSCQILEVQNCGLRIVCGDEIYHCVTN